MNAAAHDERLQHVAFNLHQHDDRNRDDDSCCEPMLQNGDGNGQCTGDREPEERDKQPDEINTPSAGANGTRNINRRSVVVTPWNIAMRNCPRI